VSRNAVIVAKGPSAAEEPPRITALSLEDGHVLWSEQTPSTPVPWGLAIDADGRAIVTLENGQVLCYGAKS
jgi:outer membrane protein assembly factor BamB